MNPIVRRYVKHATLIERCFPPEKSGETTPNSNELSYLIYYAQSKPAKLTKVGAYLSKRIARDTHKSRRPDVLISLRIFGSLLDSCGRDLHFFAKDVLGSLDTVLAANDPELAKAATHAFALFCRSHTGAALAIDRDLRHMYTRLIKTFALYAHPKTDIKDASSTQMAALGLCALQAVAESQATYAAESYYELPRIVRAVVSRITSAPGSGSGAVQAAAAEYQVASVAATDAAPALDAELLASWAWRCLETLVQKSHGQHSRIIISEIFRYLDSQLLWLPTQLCVEIVTAVIGRLQTQDQNMVIVETLAFLTDGTLSSHLYLEVGPKGQNSMLSEIESSGKDADGSMKTANRRACVIRILESMFCRPYVLVGISVMEALNVLVTFLLETVAGEQPVAPDYAVFVSALAAATDPSAAADSSLNQCSGSLADYYHLLAAIGGLATHQYYSCQLADMVGYLISKMSLGDESVSAERRQWLLQALYMVLRCTNGETAGAAQDLSELQACAGASLSLDIFAPLFTLLTSDCWELRAQTADCLVDILRHNCSSYRDSSWPSVWSPALVDAVHRKLEALLASAHDQQPLALRSATYSAAASVLKELLSVRGAEGIQDAIWVVDESAPAQENSSWVSLMAMVWTKVAGVQSNVAFERHVGSASKEAQASGCWDALVEETCLESARRIMAIPVNSELLNEQLAASPLSNAADAGVQIRARDITRKFSVKTALEFLGQDSLSQYASTKAEKAKHKKASTDATTLVDRVLCGAGSAAGASSDDDLYSGPAVSALEQINGIRARVSVDWEAQMQQRHDSLSMPQINLEQLRSALRDGLAMRSSDHVDGVGHGSPRARSGMGLMTIARGRARSDRKASRAYSTSMSSAAEPAGFDSQSEESDDGSDTKQLDASNSNSNSNSSSRVGNDRPHGDGPGIAGKQAFARSIQKPSDISTMGIGNDDVADLTDMVDANGQPVSDEIRDLLDSIDDGRMPFPAKPCALSGAAAASSTKPGGVYGHLDETSCSSAVSTPVINHVN